MILKDQTARLEKDSGDKALTHDKVLLVFLVFVFLFFFVFCLVLTTVLRSNFRTLTINEDQYELTGIWFGDV